MHCTGLLGKTCTCGQDHSSQWDTDAIEHPRSLLASGWFWFGGFVSLGITWGLMDFFLSIWKP